MAALDKKSGESKDVKSRWALLTLPHWNGITGLITILGIVVTILLGFHVSNPEETTGTLQVRRFLASNIVSSALLPTGETSSIGLNIGGQTFTPDRVQLRMYSIENHAGKYISPQDFDSPITLQALSGNRIIAVELTPPANRPAIPVTVTGGSTAVIGPTLINAGQVMLLKVFVETPKVPAAVEDPYSNGDQAIRWTAEIKGVNLSIIGLTRPQSEWIESYAPGFFVMHKANAVCAIIAIAFLLSCAQLLRLRMASPLLKLKALGILEVAVRLGLAWAAAESLISFEDTLLATTALPNWLCVGAYVLVLVLPPQRGLRASVPRAEPSIETA